MLRPRRNSQRSRRLPSLARLHARAGVVALLLLLSSALVAAPAQETPRSLTAFAPEDDAAATPSLTHAPERLALTGAADAGALPSSTPLTLTLRLTPTAIQSAALQDLLAAQLTSGSPEFRHWLTPEQFGARFGATDDQLAALTTWLTRQGFSVVSVSPSHSHVIVSGPASSAQSAFSVALHRYTLAGREYFGNPSEPSLPAALRPVLAGISGLDDLPSGAAARLAVASAETSSDPQVIARLQATLAPPNSGTASAATGDPLATLAELVDANQTPLLTLSGAICATDIMTPDADAVRALLVQAAAQGITVLASGSCATPSSASAFPNNLPELLAVTLTPDSRTTASPGTDARPTWQVAPGLPADRLRHEPDLTLSSVPTLVAALRMLSQQAGTRLGNISSTLYTLGSTPGLFSQPEHVTPGTWEPATGLGTLDVATLLRVFPRAAPVPTTTSLTADNYNVHYGQAFTLTAQVQPAAYGNASPTGTITFSSSTQSVLGSSAIDGSGRATFTAGVLPVGPNSITATYQGDGNYSSSASNPPVGVYISLVNASLTAIVSPSVSIPYGAVATVTATVTLPYLLASPSGQVTAQISSGAPSSATLSPNPGSNSATANIDLNVPPPGHYSVQVTCQGTTNFQCQTPVNLPISVVKGYTSTTVSVTPAAPQAGQPISLTATVVNSGNGTANYTYGGAITFFDSGQALAVAPVATNQATATVTLAGNRTHNITASYTGDSNWTASTSNAVAVIPTILPDTLTLSSNVSGTGSLAGVNIIFTGTVTTNVTYGTGPTGTLTFFDTFNGSVVQLSNPSQLVANGSAASIARFTTTGLLPGIHSIYAQYSGDDNYAPATSPVLTLSLSTFSVTMTPSTLTLSQGKSAQVSALVSSSGGYMGDISLGCTPPSGSEATCTFSPASISGSGTSTLTITTVAPKLRGGDHRSALRPPSHTGGSGLAGAAAAALVLLLAPIRRRSVPSLFAVFLAAALAGTVGCGANLVSSSGPGSGGSGSTPADPGTPLGTGNYVITASGFDGSNVVRRSFQYQVTIQ